jgi:fatty acid desaturase
VGDEFKDDYRKALPKDLVQQLTRRSAWRATAAILHDVAVLAAAIGAALWFWPNPFVVALAVIIIGTRQHALFVVAHEAAHYLLYDNRRLNDLVGRGCAMLQGFRCARIA